MWGGARSTYGVIVPADLDGFPRIAYQCKVIIIGAPRFIINFKLI